jgi:hypothetical protein
LYLTSFLRVVFCVANISCIHAVSFFVPKSDVMNEDAKETKPEENKNDVAPPQNSSAPVPEKAAGEPTMNGKDGASDVVDAGAGQQQQQSGDGTPAPSSGTPGNPETLKAQAKAVLDKDVNEETPQA